MSVDKALFRSALDAAVASEDRLREMRTMLAPLVCDGNALALNGAGEYVGVHIATLRRLLALAEGRDV
jgi:hypothetical protein